MSRKNYYRKQNQGIQNLVHNLLVQTIVFTSIIVLLGAKNTSAIYIESEEPVPTVQEQQVEQEGNIQSSDSAIPFFSRISPSKTYFSDDLIKQTLVAENSKDSKIKSLPLVVKSRMKEGYNPVWALLAISLLLAALTFQFLRKQKVSAPTYKQPTSTSSHTRGMVIGLMLTLSTVVILAFPQSTYAYDKLLTYEQHAELNLVTANTHASVFSLSERAKAYTGEPILNKQQTTFLPNLDFDATVLAINVSLEELTYFYFASATSAILLLSLCLMLTKRVKHKVIQSPTTPLHML